MHARVHRRGALLRLLLALLLLLAGCTAGPDGQMSPPGSQDGLSGAVEPGPIHVHGLGVNPRDNALYVATHTGLFVVAEGRARRVGERFQDTMGFTVVGPDHFLGSGHPDLRDQSLQVPGMRPLLGLIESRDAGRTWRPRSLLGEADFHALVAAHGQVYGADATSGRFMVSADQATWQTRARQALTALAVSPRDPELLVGVGQHGLTTSRDGGRRWQQLAAPGLVLLAWSQPTALWGASQAGQLFRSPDAGRTWLPAGQVEGEPAALLADQATLYMAVHDGRILRSGDQGRSWQPLLAG